MVVNKKRNRGGYGERDFMMGLFAGLRVRGIAELVDDMGLARIAVDAALKKANEVGLPLNFGYINLMELYHYAGDRGMISPEREEVKRVRINLRDKQEAMNSLAKRISAKYKDVRKIAGDVDRFIDVAGAFEEEYKRYAQKRIEEIVQINESRREYP